jgi:membrane protein required for colicin V production
MLNSQNILNQYFMNLLFIIYHSSFIIHHCQEPSITMSIDVVLLLVALYGFYLGFSDGIIKTVFSFLSYAIGLMLAIKFSPAMTRFIETGFHVKNPLILVLGFIITFFLGMYIIRFVADAMTGVLQMVRINILNQIIGGVFLSLGFMTMYSVMVWFGESTGFISPQTAAQSHTLPYLRKLPAQAQTMFSGLKPMLSDFWRESGSMMDRMERQSVQRTETEPSIYNIPDNLSSHPTPKPEAKPTPEKSGTSTGTSAGTSWWWSGDSKPAAPKVEKIETSSEIFDIKDEPVKPKQQRR